MQTATSTIETFRCMMCGHMYQDKMEKGEDKERACPKCRSNSIRHMKRRPWEDKGKDEA